MRESCVVCVLWRTCYDVLRLMCRRCRWDFFLPLQQGW
jgi:hypothetical protein